MFVCGLIFCSFSFNGTVDAARFCEYDTWHVGFQLTNQYDTWAAAISPEPPFVPTLVGSHLAYSTSNVIIVFPQVSSFPHWIYSLVKSGCLHAKLDLAREYLSLSFKSFSEILPNWNDATEIFKTIDIAIVPRLNIGWCTRINIECSHPKHPNCLIFKTIDVPMSPVVASYWVWRSIGRGVGSNL